MLLSSAESETCHMIRALGLVALMACAGSEDRSTLDSIPKAAAQAVRTQAHGMTVTKVEREIEGGEEVFEAVWFEQGARHEAKVTASGKLLELEVEVADAAVPAAVKETAARQLGTGATYVRLLSGNYEAELKHREIEIAANGTVVTPPIEDEDDDE
jgi:hypothetical protein